MNMYLARVDVEGVQRVAGETDTSGIVALDEVGILVT